MSLPLRKPAEAGLSEYEDLRQEFNEFAYVVSHDLGAPVRLMAEFARLLDQKRGADMDDEDRQFMSEIMSNGQRLQGMIQGLLAFSRLNTLASPHKPVNTRSIADHCRIALMDQMEQSGGRIVYDRLPVVSGDPDQIMQLFMAILDNGLKFVREGKPAVVRLSAEPQGDHWLFTCADNGIGMAAPFAEQVFRPFRRLHPEGVYAGIGMGLALARRIVTMHGGDIWIDTIDPDHGVHRTEDGPGTRVRFTLRG